MRISDWNSDVCSSDLYDGCVIGEDADNVGPSFDLAVKPFQWIRAGNLRPMFFCEGCVGEDVFARAIHHFGEFGRAFTPGIGAGLPLLMGLLRCFLRDRKRVVEGKSV